MNFKPYLMPETQPTVRFMPYIMTESKPGDHEKFIADKKARGLITSDEWHKKHRACPKCGNTKIRMTCAGPGERWDTDYSDDINRAYCDTDESMSGLGLSGCGWRGMVNELVEEEQIHMYYTDEAMEMVKQALIKEVEATKNI